jgi:hypothetical protein
MFENRIKTIKKVGKKAKGKMELLKHLEGKWITIWEAVSAKCYECSRFYTSGEPRDCRNPDCPLYDFHPYNSGYMKTPWRTGLDQNH